MLRRVVFSFVAFCVGAIAMFVAVVVIHGRGYVSVFLDPQKQIELLSVFLATATLAVTAVAVFIALFGIVGYAAIKAEAIAAATRAGAEAGQKAMEPFLLRERLAAGTSEAPADETGLDPLTQELARKG